MQSFGRALARGVKSGRQAVQFLGDMYSRSEPLSLAAAIKIHLVSAGSSAGPSPPFRQGSQVRRRLQSCCAFWGREACRCGASNSWTQGLYQCHARD